jgi:predicted RNA-binding Zn ribbon-like protein
MIAADDFIAGAPALDFVNTIGGIRSGAHDDKLDAYADLVQWGLLSGALSRSEVDVCAAAERADPRGAARVLKRAKVLREALHGIFANAMRGRPAAAADLAALNEEIGHALSQARLRKSAHGYTWGWNIGRNSWDAPLWTVARSAGDLLTSDRLDRLRECASDTCGWFFLDLSKNRSRRWCDMKGCGNREKLRRYRHGEC